MFKLVQTGIWENFKDADREILWTFLANTYVKYSDASGWLFAISFFYIGGMSYAAYKFLPRHTFIALIFLFTAFSFWGYATNGIRHGMATSIAMAGLPFFVKSKKQIIFGYIILILSTMTHNSCALIIAAATLSLIIKDTQTAIKIWLICILIGFIFQEPLKELMAFTLNDERMTNYLFNMDLDKNLFSTSGFRWDFIIYSSLPILLGWYVVTQKGIEDYTYSFILNLYIFANSFWVLINTVAYSNRFAYLSWFIYPILLAYPLCKFKIFERQGIALCLTLLVSIAFTIVMQI